MIDFDLDNPINQLKLLVGDVDPCDPLISDRTYQQLIERYNTQTNNECVAIWLAAKYIIGSVLLPQLISNEGGGRRREKVGGVETEFYGQQQVSSLKSYFNHLSLHPPCDVTPSNSIFIFNRSNTITDGMSTINYIKNMCNYLDYYWKDGILYTCYSDYKKACSC